MSQSGNFLRTSGPGAVVQTLTGNTGGPVGPSAGNINIIGAGNIDVAGDPGTNTLTISELLVSALQFDEDSGSAIPDGSGIINVVGAGGITTSGAGNTITIDGSGMGAGIETINGDTGSVTGATVSIEAGVATLNSGSSVSFTGVGTTLTFDVTDAGNNTLIGQGSGNATISGNNNVGLGTAVLDSLTSGDFNVGIGDGSLNTITTGVSNTSIGVSSLPNVSSGSYNTSVGHLAGLNYSLGNSSNITIGYNVQGTAGQSNTLRIGSSTAAAVGGLVRAFICGIDGVNVGSVAKVVTMASDQLGTATITAGANVTVTPGANTITISANSSSIVYAYTGIVFADSPYTVLSTDYYISADVTGGAITVRLPNAPTTGRVFVVKDKVGLAATNNITVTTVGGAVNIDGATSFVMNTAYESIQLIFNGSTYEVY
jgi:hypothetical protein